MSPKLRRDRPKPARAGTRVHVPARSSVPEPDVDPALREFLSQLPELASASNPSLFWERLLADFHESPEFRSPGEMSGAELSEVIRRGAYGFERLPDGVEAPAADPWLADAEALARETGKVAKTLNAGHHGADKATWEHSRAWTFLHREGLLEEYLGFIARLGVRSDMSVARHFVYARDLTRLIETELGRPPRVLEIGGGAGNLGVMLHHMTSIMSYTIVDLPEMLPHSAYTVQRFLDAPRLTFNALPDGTVDGPDYTFLVPERTEVLEDGSFDLCLNFNSFMEMDERTRDGYIELIYRVAAPGAIFHNINRRQAALPQRDGSTFDNNPLLFPYRSTDEVLRWEADPFQSETRSAFGRVPVSLAITRTARIRP